MMIMAIIIFTPFFNYHDNDLDQRTLDWNSEYVEETFWGQTNDMSWNLILLL